MAKSSIRKKYVEETPREILETIDYAASYIKDWTNKEIVRIRTEKDTPIIVATKNGYKIGRFRLQVLQNKTCEVYNAHNELIHRFENKVSAVLFTIYTSKSFYRSADQILMWDTEINKNYTDVLSLRRAVTGAIKINDYDLADIRQSRLEIAQSRLENARNKISNLHKQAKYNKVWE